jgi:hypothetical protein
MRKLLLGLCLLSGFVHADLISGTIGSLTGSGGGGGSTGGSIIASTQNNVAYYSAADTNTLNGLAPGTSGQVLITGGASASPFWGQPISTITAAGLGAVTNVTGNFPLASSGGSTPNLTVSNIPTTILPSTVAYISVDNNWSNEQTFKSSVTVTAPQGVNVTYGVTVGSFTASSGTVNGQLTANSVAGAGLTSCSAATSAVTWNSGTQLFGCNTISGGGGGASTLAVSTGTSAGFTPPANSSPTAVILFNSAQFTAPLQGPATAFISVNTSSITALGPSISATNNLTGTLQAAQEPAHTGDVTNSAGSLVMTAAALQNNITTFGSSITVNGAGGLDSEGPINTDQSLTVIGSATITGAGGVQVTFGVNASTFVGNGAGVTNLAGSNIVSGIPSGVLPSTVAYLSSTQTFTAAQTVNNSVTMGSSLTLTGPLTMGVGSSSAAAVSWTEGASSTTFLSATNKDNFWADISSHAISGNFNGSASSYTFITSSITPVANQVLYWVPGGPNSWVVQSSAPLYGSGGGGTTSPALPLNAVQFNSTGTFNGSTDFEHFGSSLVYSGPATVVTYGVTAGTLTLVNSTSPNTLIISSVSTGINLVQVSSAIAINPNDFIFTIASPTIAAPTILGVTLSGHVVSSGTAPTVGSCGTTPGITNGSTDLWGSVTWSGANTLCSIIFSSPHKAPPFCIADASGAAFVEDTTAFTSSMTFTLSASLTASTVTWHCGDGGGGF